MDNSRRLKVLIWAAHHLEAPHLVEDYMERARQVFEGHDVEIVRGKEAWRGRLKGIEVLVCWGFHRDILAEASDLKWIQFGSAGINHALSPELLASGIRLTTQRGIHGVTIAEHTIAMMLAFCRRLPTALNGQSARRWERGEIAASCRELQDSTAGIIGMGSIGREIASRCRALGARVIGVQSSSASGDEADEWVAKDSLETLLKKSDWVVLSCPYTPETEKLIADSEFDMMKSDAVLVNIARGQIVDEDALIEALRQNKIGGACLDVVCAEPLPPEHPLWTLPNVIITPHTAGATPLYGERGARTIASNLRAYLAGERMPTEYDARRGY